MSDDQAPKFNNSLHLVRGMCAMGVAAYHYLSWAHDIKIESAGAFLVYVFFCLSALTMMMVHGREFSQQIGFEHLLMFYRRRAARILPLLFAVALFSALLGTLASGSLQVGTLARVYLTGTTLFGLQLPGLISNVTAAWSLGIESVFYLIFPILALTAANVRFRTLVIITAALIAGQQSAILLIRSEVSPTFWFHYANPLVFSPFFLIGILIYLRPLKVRRVNIWVTAAALVAIAGFSVLTPLDVYRNPAVYLFLTAMTGIAVLSAYSAQLPEWLAGASRFLGNISYALYLTHYFTYNASKTIAGALHVQGWLQAVIFSLLSISTAHVIYRVWETPMRNLLRDTRPPKSETRAKRPSAQY